MFFFFLKQINERDAEEEGGGEEEEEEEENDEAKELKERILIFVFSFVLTFLLSFPIIHFQSTNQRNAHAHTKRNETHAHTNNAQGAEKLEKQEVAAMEGPVTDVKVFRANTSRTPPIHLLATCAAELAIVYK